MASFDKQTSQIFVKSVEIDDYILWTQGIMMFETMDLNKIVKKLERYYNLRFQFDDHQLGTLKISGKLEIIEDREEILERIDRAASVNIVKKGEDFYAIEK